MGTGYTAIPAIEKPRPIRMAFPNPLRLMAFGAAFYATSRPTYSSYSIAAWGRRLDYRRALARLGIGDPDPGDNDGNPSPAALALADAVCPGGRVLLILLRNDETLRRYRAQKWINHFQSGCVMAGLFLAGLFPVLLYRLALYGLEVLEPEMEYAPVLAIALACTAITAYYPFLRSRADRPASPVSIEDFMPSGPGDIAVNVPVPSGVPIDDFLRIRSLPVGVP